MDLSIYIPIVDLNDHIIGYEEKLDVHVKGLLHRAFSIVVFNKHQQILIHQRALHKYHSGGLWTNTCCGHPIEAESMESAVHRRLKEEMGFDCDLTYSFKFQYEMVFKNGLTENEIDHVYEGQFDGEFKVNPEEVANFRWVDMDELETGIKANPALYTVWFKEIMKYKRNFEYNKKP